MIAARLTMRAVVQRNTYPDTDPYGKPSGAPSTATSTVKCWAWSDERDRVNDESKDAMRERIRVFVSTGASVLETDVIANINDRRGVARFPGPWKVESSRRIEGHKELLLERVG